MVLGHHLNSPDPSFFSIILTSPKVTIFLNLGRFTFVGINFMNFLINASQMHTKRRFYVVLGISVQIDTFGVLFDNFWSGTSRLKP